MEVSPGSDVTFAFANIAPGRYWLIAKAEAEQQSTNKPFQPLAWNRAGRAKLRREAEAANIAIELPPCERRTAHVLRFGSSPASNITTPDVKPDIRKDGGTLRAKP